MKSNYNENRKNTFFMYTYQVWVNYIQVYEYVNYRKMSEYKVLKRLRELHKKSIKKGFIYSVTKTIKSGTFTKCRGQNFKSKHHEKFYQEQESSIDVRQTGSETKQKGVIRSMVIKTNIERQDFR